MIFLTYLLGASDTILRVVLLFLLLRGPFRRYPTFTVYSLTQACTDIAQWVMYYRVGQRSSAYRTLFWGDQVALALLLFLLVISLAYEALKDSPLRPKAGKVFAAIVAGAVILPFSLLRTSAPHGGFANEWFNHAIQIWNFGAAVMNLVLWVALLSNRKRDPQLVTLSIGVGLATASAAIAWGARLWLAKSNQWPVDSFMFGANILALILWCWAFRPRSQESTRPPSGAASSNPLSTPS